MTRTTYDELPYPDVAFGQTHPDRLAMVGTLFGINPPLPTHCRVLEIGCGTGWNLIPMAYGLPDSQFLGIDLAEVQIGMGQKAVDDLGLRNLSLRTMNILDVDETLGKFDYIIAHGIYSWVPAPVRDHILTICKTNLAQNGIAYISYNTYPGWNLLSAVRDMLRWHTRDIDAPLDRSTEAKDFLSFLADAAPPEGSNQYAAILGGYQTLLQKQREYLVTKPDSYFYHDELAEINDPVYFHQFVEHADRFGLRFVAESDLGRMDLHLFPEPVGEYIGQVARSLVEAEQYIDFLRAGTFRQTLVCHAGLEPPSLQPGNFGALFIDTHAELVTDNATLTDDSELQIRSADGGTTSTRHPVSKAALMRLLGQAPAPLRCRDLFELAVSDVYGDRAPSGEIGQRDLAMLADLLLRAYCDSRWLIGLRSYPVQVQESARIDGRPRASAVARYQAAHRSTTITNLRHEFVPLGMDALARVVLPLLDGTRDRSALLDALVGLARTSELPVTNNDGSALTDQAHMRNVLDLNLDAVLASLAQLSLLET